MDKNILVITKDQFGYHIHTQKYCEYLKNFYNVTYLCWDYGLPKIKHEGFTVKYITRKGSKLIRYFNFLKGLNAEIRKAEYDLIFIKYLDGISILQFLNRNKKFNIDIRTKSIRKNSYLRYYNDLILKFECSFFNNISIISPGLGESLKLRKWHVLPLGGDRFAFKEKSFEQIHLLYVGTLYMRNILDCVKGFHKYLIDCRPSDRYNLFFTIIGDSKGNELNEINDYINKNQLEKFVQTLGYVYYYDLNNYFEQANIGVSYIPMTKYFDNQPPTKTYEYLLSGLPVIATNTKENIKILKDNCGVLIDDNEDAFALGLKALIGKRKIFNSEDIRNLYKDNLWENITSNNLKRYIDELVMK